MTHTYVCMCACVCLADSIECVVGSYQVNKAMEELCFTFARTTQNLSGAVASYHEDKSKELD